VPAFVELGVTYTVHLWLVGKCVVDFLLVLIEIFCQLLQLRRYERIGAYRSKSWFSIGVGHFNANFSGKGSSTNSCTVGVRKLECLGYYVALFA